MDFIVNSHDLSKELSNLHPVVNAKNRMPILDNILFEVSNNKLTLTSSDLDTTLVSSIEAQSDEEDSFGLPAQMLFDTIKTYDNQPLTIRKEKDAPLEIRSAHGHCHIPWVHSDEFPKGIILPSPETISIGAHDLCEGIGNALFAISVDDLRKVLTGIHFNFGPNGTDIVSTDAHKLVRHRIPHLKREEEVKFIIPKKPATIIKSALADKDGDVLVEYNKSNAKFMIDDTVITCRLIDGKYPNYMAVFPSESPNVLTIDRTRLRDIVQRISNFSNKATYQTKFSFSGSQMHLVAKDIDYSINAEETHSCNYRGDDLTISFNSRYMTEILSQLKSNVVTLKLSLPRSAGIFYPQPDDEDGTPDHQLAMLLMPVEV